MTLRAQIASLGAAICLGFGCSEASAPSPFVPGGSAAAGAAGMAPVVVGNSMLNREPTIGGPCSEAAQCNDQIACTEDRCDLELGRCRFSPSDALCRDSVYCDGGEYCDNELGCREGSPVSCSDAVVCTLDRCVEATRSCEHIARDADGDGDPVWNCAGGGDCDDTNVAISSKEAEVCANTRDDDCDGQIDEVADCVRAEHDTCADPRVVAASGSYVLAFGAAKSDYALGCGTLVTKEPGGSAFRDVVVALTVPPGAPQDVEVLATSASGVVKLGSSKVCGASETETRCVGSFDWSQAGSVARTQLNALAPGVHPLYVFSTTDDPVTLDIKFSAVAAPATNEDCERASPLKVGEPIKARLVDIAPSLASACASSNSDAVPSPAGDLVYAFELNQLQDVHLFAVSGDTWGAPIVSLRTAGCIGEQPDAPLAPSEVTCRTGTNSELFVRSLPAGKYFVSVGGLGPTDVTLSLELGPPTIAPPNNRCDTPPELAPNQPQAIDLTSHVDAVQGSCSNGSVDATYALKLAERSDVLFVAEGAAGDTTSVGLFASGCEAADRLQCRASALSPQRLGLAGVPPGDYRVVVESALGASVTLTPWVRKAAAPILVPTGDDCSNVFQIPPGGGAFLGNTANMNADFDASCDFGSLFKGGAGDQILKLSLPEKSRVVIDAEQSGYFVLLNLRRGPECPGSEVPESCAASGYTSNGAFLSFLDRTLDPGDYFLQVDGASESVGPWAVTVVVSPAL